jgi:Fe-S-cluster containining protein
VTDTPWYADGLRFSCTRCGHCCGGAPGTIRVTDEEISDLAAHLHEADDSFRGKYARKIRGGGISLKEKPNRDCIFYDRTGGCSVYAFRPRQCRTWPFWSSVVHSPDTWQEASESCPGMKTGPLHDGDAIAATADRDGTSADRVRR